MTARLGPQAARFIASGIAATLVHYLVLWCLLDGLGMPSAGLANGIAAIAGISASFIGSRYVVFGATQASILGQLSRFWLLYLLLALLQALWLWSWTDVAGLDYRIGFVIGALAQALCTFIGGRLWVFRHAI